MYNKIYIVGPVGSGKTTFATKLSEKYNINYYELDKVCWDDDNGNINHPPVFKQWLYFISIVNLYYKRQSAKLKSLEEYKDKLVFVTSKDLKNIIDKGGNNDGY